MNKHFEVIVNTRSHVVTEENGVPITNYPLWVERLSELEKSGWIVVGSTRNDEFYQVVFHLEKPVEEKWEIVGCVESISANEATLNGMLRMGWELVSSVGFSSCGVNLVKHFLKRRVK